MAYQFILNPFTNNLDAIPSSSFAGSVSIRDEKAAGSAGGTFNSGAWQTRDLNVLDNPLSVSWVSLGSNQITLTSGTYTIIARAPSFRVAYNIAKLYNITDSADVVIGSAAYSQDGAADAMDDSVMMTTFTISGTKVFEVQHRTGTSRATDGFGVDAGTQIGASTTNVYTTVTISKIN